MRKNGAPVNPQRVKAPSVKPVSKENLADFKVKASNLAASLADHQPVKKAQRHSADTTVIQ
jgi:hypothetical protein